LKHDRDIAGGVAEWFKAPVLKTGRGFRSLVGSNPTPSASLSFANVHYRLPMFGEIAG